MNFYINYINNILPIKSNDYKEQEIIKIIVSYGIKDSKALKKNVKQSNKSKIVHQNYKYYKLPITLNPLNYF